MGLTMMPLKCCSFNCRGWNNGKLTLKNYIDSLDLCFVQEHWLLYDNLNLVREISPDFLCVGVSGLSSDSLLQGRPCGGCSILYRKSLSLSVTPLHSCSNRFCGLKICDSSGVSYLLICVYMPSDCGSASYSEYLNTLGELEGFIFSHSCDVNIVVGDFNVDFDCGGHLASLLLDFMANLGLVASDLCFRSSIGYTYESDSGLARSWIDHVICSQASSALISGLQAVHSGSILSDHFPLFFSLNVQPKSLPTSAGRTLGTSHLARINWDKVNSSNIQDYCEMLSHSLLPLPASVSNCVSSCCLNHRSDLDIWAQNLTSSLLDCAFKCFPIHCHSYTKKLVGWKEYAASSKDCAHFWYKVWVEAGCPVSGVLFQIKKNAKSRYKYEVRRLKRRQDILLQKKLAQLFSGKDKTRFWSEIRRLNHSHPCSPPCVDGVSGGKNISNAFASKFQNVLNVNPGSSFSPHVTDSLLGDVYFSDDDVLEAILQLKPHKYDSCGINTEHLKFASSVICQPLSAFLTSAVRHGYMPSCIRDSVMSPLLKGNKNPLCSDSYRPIALASCISKVLEILIIHKYSSFLQSSHLQFGFKSGSSTSLCTGTVKNIISRYTNRGSSVLGCFLDASRAFDLVSHDLLFKKLVDRKLPAPIVRFLSSWYLDQKLCVRWEQSYSRSFGVSNGVRQGSVLSPILFCIYLDGLLEALSDTSVGCHWGGYFAGAVCYADDIVLLAPSASALRHMLHICESFASSHGLLFNASKTQLICFHSPGSVKQHPTIIFNNTKLHYSDRVMHLGHILTSNLDDREDIIRVIKDINRKANLVLCKFHAADPFIKCHLIKSYCLSLYGATLWSLSSPSLHLIEVAVNKIIRKTWNLSYRSHTGVTHCIARIPTVSNIIFDRFCSFFSRAISSPNIFLRSIFIDSSNFVYSFTGYNFLFGHIHFSDSDHYTARFVRQIRSIYGSYSHCEDLISFLCCN